MRRSTGKSFSSEKWLPVIVELSVSSEQIQRRSPAAGHSLDGSQTGAISPASRFGLPLFGRNHVVGLWSDGEA